jgi:hypothetical protein
MSRAAALPGVDLAVLRRLAQSCSTLTLVKDAFAFYISHPLSPFSDEDCRKATSYAGIVQLFLNNGAHLIDLLLTPAGTIIPPL